MSLFIIGTLPLGGINLAANTAVTLMGPLLGQFDALLFGAFGLGPLEADISFQFNAALQASLSIGLTLTNPFAAILAQLQVIASLQASLSFALTFATPSLSISLGASLALSASLALKLGGLQALISAAINLKLPAIDFVANLAANLSASCVLASFGFVTSDTLSSAGTSINSIFQTGIAGILPTDTVYGVLILTKQPSASVSLSAMIRTS